MPLEHEKTNTKKTHKTLKRVQKPKVNLKTPFEATTTFSAHEFTLAGQAAPIPNDEASVEPHRDVTGD